MIRQLIEEIKINRISYLLEIIKKGDYKSKIKAYKKIEKMKITKNVGLFLIDSSRYDYGINDINEEISSSLISLCFKNYYDEYSVSIKKVFKSLSKDTQNRIVFLLSSLDNGSALSLYVDLVLEYYKDSDFIPISNLFERPHLYNLLFPKLYKTLKFKCIKNNILIILNDYLNAGVIKDIDLKKNKKLISNSISKVFNEALKFKFSNTTKALQNQDYLDLRFFLEICVNIESFVSTKNTQRLLDELFNRNDNQLSLFIMENYLRKGKSIKKLNFDTIAKDDASRYPLFDLLDFYNMKELFPAKYLKKQLIAKSDFYINFMIQTSYKESIKSLKFIKTKEVDGYEYYIFKFKYPLYFNNISDDIITNYIIQTSGLDKYNNQKVIKDFIGISGGYSLSKEPSKIEKAPDKLLYSKIDNMDEIDDVIDKLLEPQKEIKTKESLNKPQSIKKSRPYFSYLLIFLFFIFIVLLIGCVIYSYEPDSIMINHDEYKLSKIDKKYKFNEINGQDIFNQNEAEYYVLFYKKNKSNKNKYYTYINEYLKNNVKVYYVNMSDNKNEFLKNNNDFDIIIEKDKFMKVKDKEFEYYVDGKVNILKEMRAEASKFNKK